MKCTVADVVIDGASGSFDRCYCYIIPKEFLSVAKAGCRVTVPFGRGNTKKQGMILSVKVDADVNESKIKNIYGVTDNEPVLSDEMLKLCEWMHSHIFCTYFDAIHCMLPVGLNYKLENYYTVNPEFISQSLLNDSEKEIFNYIKNAGETSQNKINKVFSDICNALITLEKKQAVICTSVPNRRMKDITRKWVRIKNESLIENTKLTARQKEIADLVIGMGSVSVKEIQYFTGVTVSVINNLEQKGILESFEKEEFRTPYRLKAVDNREEINLTDEQQTAFLGLKDKLDSQKGETALLYGVTGSGKTKVYLKLVDEACDRGLGVIVMVPEIALTPQMIEIFTNRYGNKIAVFHSAMSLGQRMDEYKRIKQGKATIAIGTRSAVFAPFDNLGLIIIDEEQEHTYKSEKSPRFHARDIALFRTAYHKGLTCLASATPSVETYSSALSGKYSMYKLTKRYGNAVLPKVTVVDTKREVLEGNSSSISRELYKCIDEELQNGKQAILLLNRRGHNTYVSCPNCGWVAKCPNCSVSLTYHSANGRVMCHYCGYSQPSPKKCPECEGEHIKFMGIGTQKVEEELKTLFPTAKVLRLDADSTVSRDSFSTKLSAFSNGEYDIMLGTQMVAKGLDFSRVSLVGVIGADMAMYSEDYKSLERTFSLLTQVVGRAGRSGSDGKAVIQTVEPDSNIIELACKQDYDAFYSEEILTRKLTVFPPYCDICLVWAMSSDKSLALSSIREVFDSIKQKISTEYKDIKIIILGPCAASVPRVNGKYRYRMIIKCRNTKRFREMLTESLADKQKKDVSLIVDINPETVV
ncbi:MAG: primosomal protein N' [Clostridia bacterium]|nr:primosomal protein N' [Clostridia bacterium]